MDAAGVADLIAQGEGQQNEFKSSLGSSRRREAIETLRAFTHADGGCVLFGVTDDRDVCGASVGKSTLENLANEAVRLTQPPLSPRIDNCDVGGQTVVAVRVGAAAEGQLFYAYSVPYVRVGKTNQIMPPDEQRARLFAGFSTGVKQAAPGAPAPDESWQKRERRRWGHTSVSDGSSSPIAGSHRRKRSRLPTSSYLRQHGGLQMPLADGIVKSVEYHLGSMFSNQTMVKTDPADGFRLDVSAYGPLLCLARVNFDDGSPFLDLGRYIDF